MQTQQWKLRRHRRVLALSSVLVSAALVVAGCGSSTGNAATSPSSAANNSSAQSSAPTEGGSSSESIAPTESGSSSESSSAPAECPTADKKLNVAFVSATTSQNPMQEMAMGAQAAADEDGNTNLVSLAPPDVDGAKEVQMLESVTRTATDGIAWESVTPDLFLRPLQAVKAAGIPLVAVDNMTPKGVEPDLLVSNSNTEVGVKLGEAFVAQNPDPTGTVVLGNDIPTLSVLVDRMNGLISVIKAKLPNMKIIGPFNANGAGGVTQNTAAWQAQINANPTAVGFIGVGGPDGVSLPLIKQKMNAKWLAGSGDLPPQALQGVKDGALFALSSPEHFMKGYIAMYEIIHHARTCQPIPTGWWDSGTLLINSANIDSIIARQKDLASREAFFKPIIAAQLANPPLKPFSALN